MNSVPPQETSSAANPEISLSDAVATLKLNSSGGDWQTGSATNQDQRIQATDELRNSILRQESTSVAVPPPEISSAVNLQVSVQEPSSSQDPINKVSDETSSAVNLQVSVQEPSSSQDPRNKVRDEWIRMWNSISLKNSQIGHIEIASLRTHFINSYSHLNSFNSLLLLFDEAISYCTEYNRCQKFSCNKCPDLFDDYNNYVYHLIVVHGGGLFDTKRGKEVLLANWSEIISSGRWVPIEIKPAYSLMKRINQRSSWQDIINLKWKTYRDREISELLEEIREIMGKTIDEGYLSAATLMEVMGCVFTPKNLPENIVEKMRQVHIPICFLTKTPLQVLLNFLQDFYAIGNSTQLPDNDARFRAIIEAYQNKCIDLDPTRSFLVMERRLIKLQIPVEHFANWLVMGNNDVSSLSEGWDQLKQYKESLENEFLEAYESMMNQLEPLLEDNKEIVMPTLNKDGSKEDEVLGSLLLQIRTKIPCDVKMCKIYSVMMDLIRRFEESAGLDYRFVLLPIIKSFLKEKIENLAQKEDDENSERQLADRRSSNQGTSTSYTSLPKRGRD